MLHLEKKSGNLVFFPMSWQYWEHCFCKNPKFGWTSVFLKLEQGDMERQKSETGTRAEVKGQDRGLNNHRSLSFSWSGRSFRKSASSSLTCSSVWVMLPRDGGGCDLDDKTRVASLAVASWLKRVVWPFVNKSLLLLPEKGLFLYLYHLRTKEFYSAVLERSM